MKIKNILSVSEFFLTGGLETQIHSQRQYLMEKGVRLHLATWSPRSIQHDSFSGNTIHLDDAPSIRSPKGVAVAARRLAKYIFENEIDHVHAHPFHSILPAVAAAGLTGRPVSVTLHGPTSAQPASWYGVNYKWILGRAIFPCVGNVFAVSPEVASIAAPHISLDEIKILPNGIRSKSIQRVSVNPNSRGAWVVVSRLDEEKAKGVMKFISIAMACGVKRIVVFGDGGHADKIKLFVSNLGYSDAVEFRGMVDNPWEQLNSNYSGVAGMGRAILEGAATGLPCCLIGYHDVLGLMTVEDMRLAAKTNFSGRGMPAIEVDAMSSQLDACMRNRASFDLSNWVRAELDDSAIWGRYLDFISYDSERRGLPSTFINWLETLSSDIDILNDSNFACQADMVLERCGIYSPSFSRASLIMNRLDATFVPLSTSLSSIRSALDNISAELASTRCTREADLASTRDTLATREAELASACDALAIRETELASSRDTLAAREAELASARDALATRETELASARDTLAARDVELAAMREILTRYNRMSKDCLISSYRKLRQTFSSWPY